MQDTCPVCRRRFSSAHGNIDIEQNTYDEEEEIIEELDNRNLQYRSNLDDEGERNQN